MKTLYIGLLTTVALTCALSAQAKAPMTNKQLGAIYKSQLEADAESYSYEEDPSIERNLPDLMEGATILYSGNRWTFIPSGSIVAMPDRQKRRVVSKQQGKFLPWPRFVRLNASWLSTYPVSAEIARGGDKFEESDFEALAESRRVLVATLNGNPISVSKTILKK